jgi:hypothetical protein
MLLEPWKESLSRGHAARRGFWRHPELKERHCGRGDLGTLGSKWVKTGCKGAGDSSLRQQSSWKGRVTWSPDPSQLLMELLSQRPPIQEVNVWAFSDMVFLFRPCHGIWSMSRSHWVWISRQDWTAAAWHCRCPASGVWSPPQSLWPMPALSSTACDSSWKPVSLGMGFWSLLVWPGNYRHFYFILLVCQEVRSWSEEVGGMWALSLGGPISAPLGCGHLH